MRKCASRINGVADGGEFAEHLARIAVLEQRTVAAAPDAFDQRRDVGVEPDTAAALQDQRARLVIDEGAAAGCEHLRLARRAGAAITRRSPSRKCASPKRSKISEIVIPAARSISSSASTNGIPSRCARRRPIVDLPDAHQPDEHDRAVADGRGDGPRGNRARAFRVSRHGARGYTARAARDNGFASLRRLDKRWHWILRAKDRSGKGRWIARLIVLALLLAAFWLLLLFLGRPIEPRMIEVDVTDKIAESAPR